MSTHSKTPKFVCPFHGIVEAEETDKQDVFKCPKENCSVTRSHNDLEYPEREIDE
jgi:hypothetical protein